jgi:dsRNA-specific ribonuclease
MLSSRRADAGTGSRQDGAVSRARRAPQPPPPESGPLTDSERAAISALIGPEADDDLVRAIRDARGRTFQRLEFLGDPLLETVEALVGVLSGSGTSRHDATTDAALSKQARQLGAFTWLEWTPSSQRLADLVEAVAGAAFLSGGWKQVGVVFARIHGPLDQGVVSLLEAPASTHADGPTLDVDRTLAALGASMLETAATERVYVAAPEADEGELSALRRELHLTVHVATWASAQGLTHPTNEDRLLSDIVETWLGRLAVDLGPASAVREADRVLTEGRSLTRG